MNKNEKEMATIFRMYFAVKYQLPSLIPASQFISN